MKRFETAADNEPGKGILICQCFNKQSKFERIHAQYPLKFIPTTGHADRLAVVYMLSYGGGVISGDTFDVEVKVKQDAILLLMTQGNTKIFKDRVHQRLWLSSLQQEQEGGLSAGSIVKHLANWVPEKLRSLIHPAPAEVAPSVQLIHYTVEPHASLFVIPDPVTCFRHSSFQSRQEIHLADDSSELILLDWFTSGRITRGESWSFRHYSSRIHVHLGSRLVIKDAMVLEDEAYMKELQEQQQPQQHSDETAYASRLNPYLCFATLIMIASQQQQQQQQQQDDVSEEQKNSKALMDAVGSIQKKSEEMRLLPNSLKSAQDREVLWSVSPVLKGRGVLVRIAGIHSEKVKDFVKQECLGKGLEQIVGDGMFKKILM
ncbi:UreD urease accessory protein-domain-containing protein [Mycotypha africana]|uniref:UreD urease accessory protein-domain-containing protein n=1 Tax=Mycotypha africana TaxID=64632 RepID=UPI0023016A30|nr:UreD urease accessory protein-domain-containing protein [Mycotypha africana]KAI8991080.1 UreD urease accessory protein-domain-containing protein [Mycotypha africana]